QLPIELNPTPDVAFDLPKGGCEPFTAQFSNLTTTVTRGELTTYDWDFGDGSPHSTLKNPAHTYVVKPGNGGGSEIFTVTLVATSYFGCVSSVQHTLFVNPTPVPVIFAKPQFTTIATPKIDFD